MIFTIAAFQFQNVAFAAEVKLPTNTRVYVETTESLVAKGGKVNKGDPVGSKVWRDVIVNSVVVIAAGTPVVARIDEVSKSRMAGIKGTMSIGAYETESIDGQTIQLSGGYNKEGTSRVAGAIVGGLIFCRLFSFMEVQPRCRRALSLMLTSTEAGKSMLGTILRIE